MEKLACFPDERALLPACHDIAAAGNLLIHLIGGIGLIYLILLSASVIRNKLHRDFIKPLLFFPCFGLSLLRLCYRSASQLIADIVVCVLNVAYSKQQSLGHTVPRGLCVTRRYAYEVKPSGDIILFSLFRGNAGVKQVSERAQAAADRLVPALIRVHKALVGLVAQQLGNVALYLLLIEVAYRADDITLKLRAGVLHDGSTGNGIIQAEHRGVGAQPAGCCLPCLDVLVGQVGSVHLALEPGEHTQIVLPLSSELTGESLVLILLGSHFSEGIRVHAVNLL